MNKWEAIEALTKGKKITWDEFDGGRIEYCGEARALKTEDGSLFTWDWFIQYVPDICDFQLYRDKPLELSGFGDGTILKDADGRVWRVWGELLTGGGGAPE